VSTTARKDGQKLGGRIYMEGEKSVKEPKERKWGDSVKSLPKGEGPEVATR